MSLFGGGVGWGRKKNIKSFGEKHISERDAGKLVSLGDASSTAALSCPAEWHVDGGLTQRAAARRRTVAPPAKPCSPCAKQAGGLQAGAWLCYIPLMHAACTLMPRLGCQGGGLGAHFPVPARCPFPGAQLSSRSRALAPAVGGASQVEA